MIHFFITFSIDVAHKQKLIIGAFKIKSALSAAIFFVLYTYNGKFMVIIWFARTMQFLNPSKQNNHHRKRLKLFYNI